MAWFNERQRSPNETNLAKTHNMFMSAVLFNSQNACVHCLVWHIRYIRFLCYYPPVFLILTIYLTFHFEH